MPSIEKEPIYDVYYTSRRQYQRFLNILDGSVAQLVTSLSGVVLGGVVMVVGSSLARGKISAQMSPYIPLYIYPSYIYVYLMGVELGIFVLEMLWGVWFV